MFSRMYLAGLSGGGGGGEGGGGGGGGVGGIQRSTRGRRSAGSDDAAKRDDLVKTLKTGVGFILPRFHSLPPLMT